jgi:antitoxin component of MazEF toxin-antitoxin module
MKTLKTRKIGNSKGIIHPIEVIERCQFKKEVELIISGTQLIIQAPVSKRSTWEAVLKRHQGKNKVFWMMRI